MTTRAKSAERISSEEERNTLKLNSENIETTDDKITIEEIVKTMIGVDLTDRYDKELTGINEVEDLEEIDEEIIKEFFKELNAMEKKRLLKLAKYLSKGGRSREKLTIDMINKVTEEQTGSRGRSKEPKKTYEAVDFMKGQDLVFNGEANKYKAFKTKFMMRFATVFDIELDDKEVIIDETTNRTFYRYLGEILCEEKNNGNRIWSDISNKNNGLKVWNELMEEYETEDYKQIELDRLTEEIYDIHKNIKEGDKLAEVVRKCDTIWGQLKNRGRVIDDYEKRCQVLRIMLRMGVSELIEDNARKCESYKELRQFIFKQGERDRRR